MTDSPEHLADRPAAVMVARILDLISIQILRSMTSAWSDRCASRTPGGGGRLHPAPTCGQAIG